MTTYAPSPIPCECCGAPSGGIPYGEADSQGHTWTHYTCDECQSNCTSDEEGRPVHVIR